MAAKVAKKVIAKRPSADSINSEALLPKKAFGKMIIDAVESEGGRSGCSVHAIKKFIDANFQVDPSTSMRFIKTNIKKMLAESVLVNSKGVGVGGSFKIAKLDKKKPAASAKKTTAAKKTAKPKVGVQLKGGKIAVSKAKDRASPKNRRASSVPKETVKKAPAKPKATKIRATSVPPKAKAAAKKAPLPLSEINLSNSSGASDDEQPAKPIKKRKALEQSPDQPLPKKQSAAKVVSDANDSVNEDQENSMPRLDESAEAEKENVVPQLSEDSNDEVSDNEDVVPKKPALGAGKAECEYCGAKVNGKGMPRHQQSKACKQAQLDLLGTDEAHD